MKLSTMITKLIDAELNAMDMEGLLDYATNKMWEWFDQKSPEEIRALYETHLEEDA